MGLSARDYLLQIYDINFNIDQDLRRLEGLKHKASGVGGIDYSRDKIQTSPRQDQMCNDIIRYSELNDILNKRIDRYVDFKEKVIRQIRGLHSLRYNQILTKVYIEFESVSTAAREIGISRAYASQLHNQALRRFEEMYPDLDYFT